MNDPSKQSHCWSKGPYPSKTIEINGWMTPKPSKNHWKQWSGGWKSFNGDGWVTQKNITIPSLPKNDHCSPLVLVNKSACHKVLHATSKCSIRWSKLSHHTQWSTVTTGWKRDDDWISNLLWLERTPQHSLMYWHYLWAVDSQFEIEATTHP